MAARLTIAVFGHITPESVYASPWIEPGGAMRDHDDHPTHEELRLFIEKYGSEILEVIREQNLTGVDDATRFQSALRELSVRWGMDLDDDEPA